ncbi:hypothetical protein G9A89_022619 [Geosiphon pyriformis]|nr:hypothetical protein G9A89_022619 [Geosiphon pyriformis]
MLLFTLPVETTVHDLGDLLVGAGGKTCVINRFLDTGNRVYCAVVCFENDKELESAFCTEPIFGRVRLSWARLDMVQCEQYGKLDHSVLKCDAETSTSLTLSKSFKRVVSDENCLQLAKLYVKKSVLISRPAAFGGKSWVQVVFLVSSSNGPHFGSGPGFGSSFGASGVVDHLSPTGSVSSFLETCLTSLEHSLKLFMDKMSGIVDKPNSLNLVFLAFAFSSQSLVVPRSVNLKFGSDMVLNEPKSVVLPPFSVSSGASSLGSSSSKILTLKVGCLESKLMALKALVCSVLEKLNQMCAGSGSAVSSQVDIVRWHRDMNNLVSIIIETKLKDKVFVSGLDSGYLGSGVAIIMNNTLAKHVCKVFEVSSRLLSVKLLFKNKLSVLILGLYAGASVSACFSQVDEINSLITKAVNESSFMILGGDFNEDGFHKCTSFRKCFDLGLVNVLGRSLFGKNVTWTNSRGVTKTIDYVFVSLSLVNAILDCSVTRVDEYFDTNHRTVIVFVDLRGLLDANKNRWRFNFKDATTAKWAAFKESSAATTAIFKCEFDAALLFLDLDAIWNIIHKIVCLSANDVFKKKWFKGYNNVFTKKSSKFHKLELLVFKLVKASCLVFSKEFVVLLGTWNLLNATNTSVVESLFLSGSHFEVIRSVLFRVRKLYRFSKLSESKHAKESRIRSAVSRRMESFEVDKGHTIKSVLEHSFHKVVLDHLVVDNKLVLDPSLVKFKVDVIIEGWTRKCELVTDISADWCCQYQPLEYVFDDVFSRIMDPISSIELLGVVSELSNDKAAGLSAWVSMISKPYEWEGILSKILSDRISLACSTHNILHGNNFSVLKGTTTQFSIFAVGSVDMKKTYDSVSWEHLKKSLIRIKMFNRVMIDFGLTNGYQVHDGLDQEEVFSLLLWHIFYDPLLCEVKRQEEFCGYRLNSHFVAKTGCVKPQAGFSSFFAAGAFVNDTIWVGSSQTATQHILNVASEFFRINDILINNDKTVAIPINCKVVSPFLTISDALISFAKKGEPHQYLGIFLSMDGLSKPSLAKAHSDVWFFTNLVLKKTISNKQFSYLVLVVLHPINALIHKGFKSKAEGKLASVVCFANATLSWCPVHPLVSPACLKLNLSNNFLASVVHIFADCSLFFSSLGSSTFRFSHGIPMSLVLGKVKFSKCLFLLRQYGIAFVKQLRHCNGNVFDWKTFKRWKRLDLRGPISNWFSVSVGYLGSAELFSSVYDWSVGVSFAPNVLESINFDLVHNYLLGLGADSFSVYTNRSLAGLSTLSVKLGVVVFFDNINMGLGIRVSGLLLSTLAKLQAIALALKCVSAISKVCLFSDSQAMLNTCRSELSLTHLDFRNSCWVECHHIADLVKRHSGVIGNDWANELAGCVALSDFVFPPQLNEQFILAGSSPVLGNSRHFVHDIYQSIHRSRWGFSSGTRAVAGKLFTDINWHRSSSVWHSDSHIAAGFTSMRTAGLRTYFMKALHYRLPVAIRKCLYDRSYPNVVCLYCGCVEEGISGLHCSFSHMLQTLSSCVFDTSVHVALYKGFVFNDWFFEAVSVFGDLKLAGTKIVDFVHDFCLAFRDEVWLVHVKHHVFMEKHGLIPQDSSMPVTISGLYFLYSAGVVKLLGIDDALDNRFGLHKFKLFISSTLNAVSIHIGA